MGDGFSDLFWGNLINLRGIGVPLGRSEGGVASDGLFKSIGLSLESDEDIGLQDILGSVEFISGDGSGKSLQGGNGVIQKSLSVAGSSGKSESEKSGVGELSVEGGTSIDVRLLGGQSIESVSVEEGGSELEGPSVSRLPVGSLEVESDSEGVVLGQVSDFSSLVLGWVSGLGAGSSWNVGELVLNQVNELLVVIDSGSGDEDFFWGNVLELELLEDVAGEISDVTLKSLEGETESLESVGGSEDGVVEVLTGLQELVEFVGVLVLGLSDLGGDDGSWLESAIGDHGENVNDVVGEGGSVEVGLFLVVLHLEVSSGHLDDTVVDGFVGVEDGLQIGVLDGQERSGGFIGLISGSNVQ